MGYRACQRQLIPKQPCTPVPNTEEAAKVRACQGIKHPQEMWVLERSREVGSSFAVEFVPVALTTVTLKM